MAVAAHGWLISSHWRVQPGGPWTMTPSYYGMKILRWTLTRCPCASLSWNASVSLTSHVWQAFHYHHWLMVEANELAELAGQPQPYPHVEKPRPDNGEEYLYAYFISQLKREQQEGWLAAVSQLKDGEELTHCPCDMCTVRRRTCACAVCTEYRRSHPEFAPSAADSQASAEEEFEEYGELEEFGTEILDEVQQAVHDHQVQQAAHDQPNDEVLLNDLHSYRELISFLAS